MRRDVGPSHDGRASPAKHRKSTAVHLYLSSPHGGGGRVPDREELPHQRQDDRGVLRLPHQEHGGCLGHQRAALEAAESADAQDEAKQKQRLIHWKYDGSWLNRIPSLYTSLVRGRGEIGRRKGLKRLSALRETEDAELLKFGETGNRQSRAKRADRTVGAKV
jgi:hypothetical protein